MYASGPFALVGAHMPAPIVVFAFNRPDHLRRTLRALAANDLAAESRLTIFCDGPRSDAETQKTKAVRNVAKSAQGFASVSLVEREKNFGCAASVIDGLTRMFEKYEQLIVIEDDILTSPYTLRFLNAGLNFYSEDKRIFNIAAWSPPITKIQIPADYSYDIYAVPRFNCCGWASWRDRFEGIDWKISDYHAFRRSSQQRKAFNAGGADMSPMLDAQMAGSIDSWAIRADYWRFKNGQLGVNPVRAYTTNIGMDCGTHCNGPTSSDGNHIELAKPHPFFVKNILVNKDIEKSYKNFYSPKKSCYSIGKDFLGRRLPPPLKRTIKNLLSKII